MDFRRISKAIAGSLGAAVAGTGSVAVAIPADIVMPWYGYVIVGLVNAGIAGLAVYWAPANTPSSHV